MTEQSRETEVSWVRLRPDGIVELRYKRDSIQSLEHAKHEVSIIKELLGDRAPAPLLVEVGASRRQEGEARHYLVEDPAVAEVISRTALLVRTPISRVLATIFTRLQSPTMAVKVFSDEEEAVAWLLEARRQ